MWPDATEIEELLDRARSGDDGAVNRLLDRHRESLLRLVAMRLDRGIRRRVDASDIVQDVLLEAHSRLQSYLREPRMPFYLWLRALAMDRLVDAHRRHRAAQRRSVDRERPVEYSDRSSIQLVHAIVDRNPTPATEAMRRELGARFEEALERLSSTDREILLLRHFECASNQEAARALDLSEPAAAMRYLRALRRLRELLEEDGDPSGTP